MKIKPSELTGAALDWAVAEAVGDIPIIIFGSLFVAEDAGEEYSPSTDWAQGGPLIEKHGIWLSDDNDESPEKWIASVGGVHMQTGPTPLIAAMRALVAAKLGDEIEVPDELAQAAAER